MHSEFAVLSHLQTRCFCCSKQCNSKVTCHLQDLVNNAMCIWVMPLLKLIKLFTPFSVLRVYFLCLLREMCSQHNCWTCMCKGSYQEGEKWKTKRQSKAFWKYLYLSCRSYPRINSGRPRSLMWLDTVTFLQVEEEKKED